MKSRYNEIINFGLSIFSKKKQKKGKKKANTSLTVSYLNPFGIQRLKLANLEVDFFSRCVCFYWFDIGLCLFYVFFQLFNHLQQMTIFLTQVVQCIITCFKLRNFCPKIKVLFLLVDLDEQTKCHFKITLSVILWGIYQDFVFIYLF